MLKWRNYLIQQFHPGSYTKELRAGSPGESSGVTALPQMTQRWKDTKCIPMCEWIRKIFGMMEYYSAINKRSMENCCEMEQPWEHIIQTMIHDDGHQCHWHCCGTLDRFTETGGEITATWAWEKSTVCVWWTEHWRDGRQVALTWHVKFDVSEQTCDRYENLIYSISIW